MSPDNTWGRFVRVALGILALSGLLWLSPGVVMIGSVAAGLAAAIRLAWMSRRDGHAKTGWEASSKAWRPAALGFGGVLVLNGLHALLGSAALPIGAAAAIAALVASVVLRRPTDPSAENAAESPASAPRTSTTTAEEPAPGTTRSDAPSIPALPTPALCWEWRRSYVAVTRASQPDELTRIVALRAAYLDELERRDPTGFRRWLWGGARAAGDPGRYLTSGQPGRSSCSTLSRRADPEPRA
jgi:hypothetical protein